MSWFCPRNALEFVYLLLYNVGLLSNKNEVINADSFLTSKPWDNVSWEWILNLFPTFPKLPRLWLSNPESLQKQQMLYFWWSDPQSPVNIAKVHSHYRKERQQQTITTTSKVPDLDGATIIAVLRDPLFAALSDFHRTKSGSDRHISHANRNFFDDGKKWHEFAIKYVSKWKWFFDVIFKRYGAKNK